MILERYTTAYRPYNRSTEPFQRLRSLRTALTLADPMSTSETIVRYEARIRGVDLDAIVRTWTTTTSAPNSDVAAVASFAVAYRAKTMNPSAFAGKTAPAIRAYEQHERQHGLAAFRDRTPAAPVRVYGAAQAKRSWLSRAIDGVKGLFARDAPAYA